MANEPKTTSVKTEDVRNALEEQISDLRDEIARINEIVAERSAGMMSGAKEKASEVYEGAADRAARATKHLRNQANVVSEVARENPGTAASILGVVGVIGFMLGMVVGQSTVEQQHRNWRGWHM